jgi:hypothetical protein
LSPSSRGGAAVAGRHVDIHRQERLDAVEAVAVLESAVSVTPEASLLKVGVDCRKAIAPNRTENFSFQSSLGLPVNCTTAGV